MPSISHKYEQLLLKHIFKIHNSKFKSIFEPKSVINLIFINSSPFALLINVKQKFQKEWCTFGRKTKCLRKTKIVHFQSLNALNM